ncbi:MAG: hypothetical protein PVG04_08885 [Anaerolineales bacterium]|jgi:hypothetical protein
MSFLLYGFYTFLNLALLVWGVLEWNKHHRISSLLITAVTFGLVYDNLILTLGAFMEAGATLYVLSLPRFYLHQIVLPWIIWASFLQIRAMGFDWAQSRLAATAVLSLTMVIILLGVLTRIVPMDLQPIQMGGVNRYMDEAAAGPPIVSIVSIGFAGVMGVLLWRNQGWPWVFLSALLVFITEGIPIELVRRVLGSGAEVLFIAAMLLTETRSLRSNTDRSRSIQPDS